MEEQSILDIVAIILTIFAYAKVKYYADDQEVDPYFLEKVNVESGLNFPMDTGNMGLNKKMYVDFLVKIFEHSKKRFLDKNIPFEKGPGGRQRLSDKAFNQRSLYNANSRWVKVTTPDGLSVWKPVNEPFNKSIRDSMYYAKGRFDNQLDVNVVGAFGQQPRTTKDIMMLKDRNEALKRSTVYSQLLEQNSDGDLSDETIANLADEKIKKQGYVTGIDDRKFQNIRHVYSVAYREDLNLQEKVEIIRGFKRWYLTF